MNWEARIAEILADKEAMSEILENVEQHKIDLALFGKTTLPGGVEMSLDMSTDMMPQGYIDWVTQNPCEVEGCGVPDEIKPMCFRGERWCSDDHRKIILGEVTQ